MPTVQPSVSVLLFLKIIIGSHPCHAPNGMVFVNMSVLNIMHFRLCINNKLCFT